MLNPGSPRSSRSPGVPRSSGTKSAGKSLIRGGYDGYTQQGLFDHLTPKQVELAKILSWPVTVTVFNHQNMPHNPSSPLEQLIWDFRKLTKLTHKSHTQAPTKSMAPNIMVEEAVLEAEECLLSGGGLKSTLLKKPLANGEDLLVAVGPALQRISRDQDLLSQFLSRMLALGFDGDFGEAQWHRKETARPTFMFRRASQWLEPLPENATFSWLAGKGVSTLSPADVEDKVLWSARRLVLKARLAAWQDRDKSPPSDLLFMDDATIAGDLVENNFLTTRPPADLKHRRTYTLTFKGPHSNLQLSSRDCDVQARQVEGGSNKKAEGAVSENRRALSKRFREAGWRAKWLEPGDTMTINKPGCQRQRSTLSGFGSRNYHR